VAGDSHRRRRRAVPRQRPGSGGAAWQRGEPAALARPARRGEVEEEDEGDRSRAALLAPLAVLAARRERSGEGGSGRERERGRGRRSRSLENGNPKLGIIFVSLDSDKKPYKVNKSAKNSKKLERTTGSCSGRESASRDLGHRFENPTDGKNWSDVDGAPVGGAGRACLGKWYHSNRQEGEERDCTLFWCKRLDDLL